MSGISRISLLVNKTATGKGDVAALGKDVDSNRGFKARVVGTGAVAATIDIYASDEDTTDNTKSLLLGTITLSGTTSDVDGFASDAPWPFVYADLTAISGTGATVNCGVST